MIFDFKLGARHRKLWQGSGCAAVTTMIRRDRSAAPGASHTAVGATDRGPRRASAKSCGGGAVQRGEDHGTTPDAHIAVSAKISSSGWSTKGRCVFQRLSHRRTAAGRLEMPGYQALRLVIRDLTAPPLKAHGVCAAPSGA